MEGSILTEVFLPVSLGIIMLGMGFGLSPADFKRVFAYPKGVLVGLTSQILFLPVVAFLLVGLFPLQPELAVGVVLIAACPGGATSNLVTNLAQGNVALSISLTAFSSAITVFSIPFVLNFAMARLLGEGSYVPLPVGQTILQVFAITLLPVGIGMLIKAKKPRIAERGERPLRIFSAVFLALIIVAAILKDRENLVPFFRQAGPVSLLLNVTTMGMGFLFATIFGLDRKQKITILIEVGIQNGTLGIAIAAALLKNPTMAIPPAIYSLTMFATAGVVIGLAHYLPARTPEKEPAIEG